jgi:hypothetical protein
MRLAAALLGLIDARIAEQLKGLMLVEQPTAHYLLDLGNDRRLGIWFDGASKDRPIYWLDLTEPQIEESGPPTGTADVKIVPRSGAPMRVDMGRSGPGSKTASTLISSGIDPSGCPPTTRFSPGTARPAFPRPDAELRQRTGWPAPDRNRTVQRRAGSPGTGATGAVIHQNDESGLFRNSASSSVVARPSAALRWGKRPKRLMIS